MSDEPKTPEPVDPGKAKDAAEIAAQYRRLSATLPDSISERVRTLVLGSLVVVWGVFSGEKGKSNLNVTEGPRKALLVVALGAVLVLALDIVEYIFRLESAKHLAGQKTVLPDWFQDKETVTRWIKVTLGLLTLALLCITIAYLLFHPGSAHAQENSLANQYVGLWCGGLMAEGTYSCLNITALSIMESTVNGPGIKVRYSFQKQEKWIACFHIEVRQATLQCQCGKGIITATRPQGPGMGFQIRVGDRSFESHLYKVR